MMSIFNKKNPRWMSLYKVQEILWQEIDAYHKIEELLPEYRMAYPDLLWAMKVCRNPLNSLTVSLYEVTFYKRMTRKNVFMELLVAKG